MDTVAHRPPRPRARGRRSTGDGRDARTARFGKGNTTALGHVNPTARARAELQKALVAAVSKADTEALTRRLLADALRGQVASAELLLKHVFGKPAKAEDPDRVALDGWRLIQSWRWPAEMVAAAGRAIEPELAQFFGKRPVTGR